MRGGITLNSIEVIQVHDVSFFGRIVRRDGLGMRPKEGDMAAILPPVN